MTKALLQDKEEGDPQKQVPYDLPDKSRWNGLFLVGEAPGAEEARLGHPFVGRSGQLLDEMMARLGIARADCLVANVFRVRPPGNKVDHFFLSRRAADQQGVALAERWGKFTSSWCLKAYEPDLLALQKTLEVWQPRCVIALGRTPLWALSGENTLLKHVGQFLPSRLYEPAPVMPTFHPSYILRGNWKLVPDWEAHFRAVLQHIGG